MASPPPPPSSILLLLLLFSTILFTTTTTARPCKTIFFITSSSSSHHNNNKYHPRLTFFITEIRDFNQSLTSSLSSLLSLSSDIGTSEPYNIATSAAGVIRGRTMDIMSIVGAVIFGVGCGAITAVTMYLVWSLFAPRQFEFCSDSEESGDEENVERCDNDNDNDNEGYFEVPVAVKTVPPSADEVDRIAGMK